MQFTPKTAEELQISGLLVAGIYPFTVINAKDKPSKAGNPMIEIQVKVWDKEGNERVIFDYLLAAMAYKLRHFCEAVGMLDKYESGELNPSDCLGKKGRLELVIQPGNPKPEGGFHPAKNSVKDYLIASDKVAPVIAAPDFVDDDLPF